MLYVIVMALTFIFVQPSKVINMIVLLRLKEDRMRFTCNLEVQLLLKQGQVEVDAGPFIHDYLDSILIHRSVVEDLNTNIRVNMHNQVIFLSCFN